MTNIIKFPSERSAGAHKSRQPSANELVRPAILFPDLYIVLAPSAPPTFGERLEAFGRRWSFRIAVACYVIGVSAGCYFAFQLGRGVL